MSAATTAHSGGVFLTGATGFVGLEVLERYLRRTDRPIYALVRAPDERAARERLHGAVAEFTGTSDLDDRVRAVPGDIEQEGLGLASAERDRLAEEVGDIVHAAASVSFSLPLEQSRSINAMGTRRMLEFAESCRDRGGLDHFSYVSTAYVAGTHEGEFSEDDFDVGQDFRNPYERSKYEAERLVRDHRDRLPVQLFRPSIVVGERATGWTASFNVLYGPLRAFSRGTYRLLPGRASAPVDVVPVDYVADAIFELCTQPVAGGIPETYHLVAGRRATTVGRLIELSADYFRRRPPRLIAPSLYRRLVHRLLVWGSRGKRRRALKGSEIYFPYFSAGVRYRDERTRRRLEPAGIRVTPVEQYFSRLADYAVAARWGKSAPSRRALAASRQPASRATASSR